MLNKALRQEYDKATGKRVSRDSSGIFYLLESIPEKDLNSISFFLRISANKAPSSINDFGKAIPLIAPNGIIKKSSGVLNAAMIVDHKDQMHLSWNEQDGMINYCIFEPKKLEDNKFKAAVSETICKSNGLLGDITLAPDNTVWLSWIKNEAEHQGSIFIGSFDNNYWKAFELTSGYGYAPPSLCIDSHNCFHITWHDINEYLYVINGKLEELDGEKSWQAERIMDNAHRPALAETDNKIIAAYSNVFCALDYCFANEKQPEKKFITFPDKRFTADTSHSTRFSIDNYGIPWLFFIESTRQHVFYTRWLGTKWAPISNGPKLLRNTARMDDNHLSIDRLSVEEKIPSEKQEIAIVYTHESAFPETAFHKIVIPEIDAASQNKVLFFDLKEIQYMENINIHLNQATKYHNNPIISNGDKDDFDAHGAGTFNRVIKVDGVYKMWYYASFIDHNLPWQDWGKVGYAESKNGCCFEKIKLGLASFHGKNDTSIIPELPYIPAALYDIHDPDPEQRYKMISFSTNGTQNKEIRAGRMDPWQEINSGYLFTSPDGIHWKKKNALMTYPSGKPYSIVPMSFFYDEQEKNLQKKYKLYGFTSLNLARRGGAYAYSPDAINWTACENNPVLDPFARAIPVVRGGKLEQIHDFVVMQYHGYYLGLYQYQKGPEELEVELAVSRNGEDFVFINSGEKLIPRGNSGEWDSSSVSASIPFVDGDEIKCYYGGYGEWSGKRASDGSPRDFDKIPRGGGLATLRLDGFTHLEIDGESTCGSITTIPIKNISGKKLYLNVDCGKNAHIEVELIDPKTKQVVPGYSRQECRKINANHIKYQVIWESDVIYSDNNKPLSCRFYFYSKEESPKLYSFCFV